MPSPGVHVGQGFLHRHVVFDGIDVVIYFGIVGIKGSGNITYSYIWEVVFEVEMTYWKSICKYISKLSCRFLKGRLKMLSV